MLEDPEGLGARYMVVDCGGGTVDITVHEIVAAAAAAAAQQPGVEQGEGQLREVFKATGGPYGSVSEFSFTKHFLKHILLLVLLLLLLLFLLMMKIMLLLLLLL